jgi:hypothetical protein
MVRRVKRADEGCGGGNERTPRSDSLRPLHPPTLIRVVLKFVRSMPKRLTNFRIGTPRVLQATNTHALPVTGDQASDARLPQFINAAAGRQTRPDSPPQRYEIHTTFRRGLWVRRGLRPTAVVHRSCKSHHRHWLALPADPFRFVSAAKRCNDSAEGTVEAGCIAPIPAVQGHGMGSRLAPLCPNRIHPIWTSNC